MTSPTPPPEFRAAIADIAAAAMAYGAMMGLNGRHRLEELLRADPSRSLGDALAPEVESLIDIRPSLVETAYTAAQTSPHASDTSKPGTPQPRKSNANTLPQTGASPTWVGAVWATGLLIIAIGMTALHLSKPRGKYRR